MITIDTIKNGFKSYYKDVILPMSWKMSLVEPIVMIAIDNAERTYKPILDMLKNEDGSIDAEKLYEEYRKKIQAMGSFDIAGIRFNANDIDLLMEHIRKAEVKM